MLGRAAMLNMTIRFGMKLKTLQRAVKGRETKRIVHLSEAGMNSLISGKNVHLCANLPINFGLSLMNCFRCIMVVKLFNFVYLPVPF